MPLTPQDFTFGVEIECFLPAGRTREELATAMSTVGIPTSAEFYNHVTREAWKIVTDGSLGDYVRGAEVVSPVLKGEAGLAAVRAVCAAVEAFGCTVDQRCGLHVHVGVPEGRHPSGNDEEDISSHSAAIEFMKRVVALWAKHESTIDALLPPSRRQNNYCRPVGATTPVLKRAKTLRALARAYHKGSRYVKVNLRSYWVHGTVEFRQHSGTVDGRKVANWVRFCLALCAKATEPEVAPLRVGRLNGSARLRRSQTDNPKRYGSAAYHLWRLYQDGMTVAEAVGAAVVAGHTEARVRSDISYNIGTGLLILEGATAVQATGLSALLAEIDAPADLAAYLAARHAHFASRFASPTLAEAA